jgi:hypothetical protein
MNPDPYKPVKCPDCSTWWRGYEHRCGAREDSRWVIHVNRPPEGVHQPRIQVYAGGGGSLSVTTPPGTFLVNGSGDEEPPDPQRAGALV